MQPRSSEAFVSIVSIDGSRDDEEAGGHMESQSEDDNEEHQSFQAQTKFEPLGQEHDELVFVPHQSKHLEQPRQFDHLVEPAKPGHS